VMLPPFSIPWLSLATTYGPRSYLDEAIFLSLLTNEEEDLSHELPLNDRNMEKKRRCQFPELREGEIKKFGGAEKRSCVNWVTDGRREIWKE
jgi:hypothetical protein